MAWEQTANIEGPQGPTGSEGPEGPEGVEGIPGSVDHYVQNTAPASPNTGTVWINPDEPPEGEYLLLTGGELTGPLSFPGGELTSQLRATNGAVAGPTYGFIEFPNSGMYLSLGKVRIASEGVFQAEFRSGGIAVSNGTAAAPPLGFQTSSTLGMFRTAGGGLGFAHGGVERMEIASTHIHLKRITTIQTNFYIVPISDTSNAANVYIAGDGRFFHSTSSLRNKVDVEYDHALADLKLRPVTFTSIAGRDNESRHFGFIAEDMPHERMIQRDMYNDIDGYDLQAVVAVLAAKVNRLEAARG